MLVSCSPGSLPAGLCKPPMAWGRVMGTSGSRVPSAQPGAVKSSDSQTPHPHLCRALCASPRLSILVSASRVGKLRHGVGKEPSKTCAVLPSTSVVGTGLNQLCPRLCCSLGACREEGLLGVG